MGSGVVSRTFIDYLSMSIRLYVNEHIKEHTEMYEQGFILMGAGMGVVGLFLTIMVAVMYGSAAIIKQIEDASPPPPESSGGGSKSNDLAEIAVAIAAVQSHSRS